MYTYVFVTAQLEANASVEKNILLKWLWSEKDNVCPGFQLFQKLNRFCMFSEGLKCRFDG